METSESLVLRLLSLSGKSGDAEKMNDCMAMIRALEQEDAYVVDGKPIFKEETFKKAHEYNKRLRSVCAKAVRQTGSYKIVNIYNETLLFDAPYDFDCYCRYIEHRRERGAQFYINRREQLKPVVDALQSMADDKIDLLAISLPPGVGKTTIAIFYLTWLAGRNPELQNLASSHNAEFLRGLYDECLRIMTPGGEYAWAEVFPGTLVCRTNAKALRIDVAFPKRYETLEFTSVEANNAGKVRATNLLYCDDLVSGIDEALSIDRMDRLWRQYNTDLRQRKVGNRCKELHIATRWSVHDVIGRLEEQYGDDPRSLFIKVPALDEHDESNFDYPYGLGYTTKDLLEQREIMDDASWRALYMNEPIEREGQLYPQDRLRRYFELPEADPDGIIAVCDTKAAGSDYCVLLIGYLYGQDVYVEDCVCENYAPDVVENSLVRMLLKHNPHMARFESNAAGGKVAQVVQERVKEGGGKTRIETKWTQANKETKIQMEQPWVLDHCLFRDDTVLRGSEWIEYRDMLRLLCGYTLIGRNKHDDVPDAFAQLSQYVQGIGGNRAEIVKRPF